MTMINAIAIAAIAAVPAAPQVQPGLAGAWEGRVAVGGQSIRVVFHVGADGTTTMDSPDQGGFGIPAEAPVVEAGVVRIAVPAIGGRFEGRLSENGLSLNGALHQGGASLPVVLARRAATPLAGVWEGPLEVGGRSIRLVFRVASDGRAVMDSPDQGARDIALEPPTVDGAQVRFAAPGLAVSVEGRLSEDGRTITGTFRQGGAELPLVLSRAAETADLSRPRPQTPKPPFPYRSEEVAFDNPASPGVRLAGTLTLPQGAGPFPAAVIITGTGPQDRDETIEGHKPFAVWADALTRRGVAVLRFDDRGIGGSTGDFEAATGVDFASDVAAVFAGLAARPDIDSRNVGLIGHSEGAVFAYLAMEAGLRPAWLVTLAGQAVRGGDIITEQTRRIAAAGGLPPEEVEVIAARQARLMDAVARHFHDGEAVRREVEATAAAAGLPADAAARTAQAMSNPWYRAYVAYDPAGAIRAIEVPMLAVFGGNDLQVPADQNAPAMARLNPDADVVVLPGLNHLFQPADTGLMAEYGQIETTLDPSVIETVVDWVAVRAGL